MKIKMRTTAAGPAGVFLAGSIHEVSDAQGREWAEGGYAEDLTPKPEQTRPAPEPERTAEEPEAADTQSEPGIPRRSRPVARKRR